VTVARAAAAPPPVPDPTTLTTQQLLREISSLRELMRTSLDGTREITQEKFRSVERYLEQAEGQRVEQKADTKAAVDAALSAAKEAVKEQTIASERAIAKSEAATSKQLEQQSATFSTAIGGVTVALGDVKDRVGKIEYVKQGAAETRVEYRDTTTEARAGTSQTITLAAVAVSVLSFGAAVAALLIR